MTAAILRTLESLASALGTTAGRLRDRLERDRHDRDIARLKAHLSWHETEGRDRGPRARR